MTGLALCLLASKRYALAFYPKIILSKLRYQHAFLPKGHIHSRTHHGLKHVRPFSFLAIAHIDDEDEYIERFQGNNQANIFEITAPYNPTADQPQAISKLVENVRDKGDQFSILRGCTGTGKTMVMAHCIAKLGKPTLVLCHNKTLAAQLARELRSCLANNHVQLFVSYYNHYVPESYSETSGKYNAKKSSVNDELDALRHMATRALVQHRDVVVVASVSCIYGLGMPKSYLDASLSWNADGSTQFQDLKEVIDALEGNLYDDALNEELPNYSFGDLSRGQYELVVAEEDPFRASISLWPPADQYPMRVDLVKNRSLDRWAITTIAIGHNSGLEKVQSITIFPAKHHVSDSSERFEEALRRIDDECTQRSNELRKNQKHLEADRLQQRVSQDLLLLKETGTCSGVENYSRHFNLRDAGEPPDTLLDYFGLGDGDEEKDWLLMVDESHVTLPQLKAMYGGDRARKLKLVKHGYRLPSALDNRPLKYDEFWERVKNCIFVSATPSNKEYALAESPPVDMVIRPTFVCDPIIETRSTQNQLDDLVQEIIVRAERNERTLALALTKRDAEDLSGYLIQNGINADYIHSGLKTHDRSNVLKALQDGTIDCLVGVNVLREGLDLPQVSLVAILNADTEGFLRSETALLQMIGRAARNVDGMAIFYADRVTRSMKACIDATKHRRKVQLAYNAQYGKEMRSTQGSSIQSIFEILKDQIQAQQPLEIVNSDNNSGDKENSIDSDLETMISVPLLPKYSKNNSIVTDHIPSKPGIYFWKDKDGSILYIGKAKRLRSRVKSYLSPNANHTHRIKTMLKKAKTVEFLLTPSEGDALILESNLIKHHQPLYNVLLKDDTSYPYICASIGDALPSFSVVPRRIEGKRASKYKYFGPYPHYSELNNILAEIEKKYELRSKSFQTRFGTFGKTDYEKIFQKALQEVFLTPSSFSGIPEGSKLFDSRENESRDVVAVGQKNNAEAVIHLVQLRNGLVAGQFTYSCELASGIETDEDFGAVIQTVLERKHYPQGEALPNSQFSFFPDELLVQYPLPQIKTLKESYRLAFHQAEPNRDNVKFNVRTPAQSGRRKDSDLLAMQFAIDNAQEKVRQQSYLEINGVATTSVDGTATKELAELLFLDKEPSRIECYDISHTQGNEAVGSRVVFVDGKPRKELYRVFNIKTVDGIDDYASIAEVLERRFRKAWTDDKGELVDVNDPWSMPDLIVIDGGKGQLSAALKGMAKASVTAFNINKLQVEVEDSTCIEENAETYSLDEKCPRVPVVSLAKNMEEVFVPYVSGPINDSPDSAALLLLRSLRDESHRFALTAHQKRRSKALIES